MLWEGLFFSFWHSDKSPYQKDLAEKISKLFTQIGQIDHQKLWFEAFLYIANSHWDRVDNYRIDKYLMFLRFQLHEVLQFLKQHEYSRETVMDWFNDLIRKLFSEENTTSKGIPLQLCDVFLQELNKIDAEGISYKGIAILLEPFLQSLGTCRNKILLQRITEKVFAPMLENNVTPTGDTSSNEDTDDGSQEVNYDPKKGKWVDGGKLPPKTQKEV
jgi:ribosomal RNA-processing protein 1